MPSWRLERDAYGNVAALCDRRSGLWRRIRARRGAGRRDRRSLRRGDAAIAARGGPRRARLFHRRTDRRTRTPATDATQTGRAISTTLRPPAHADPLLDRARR